jgi:hypothetical protein
MPLNLPSVLATVTFTKLLWLPSRRESTTALTVMFWVTLQLERVNVSCDGPVKLI